MPVAKIPKSLHNGFNGTLQEIIFGPKALSIFSKLFNGCVHELHSKSQQHSPVYNINMSISFPLLELTDSFIKYGWFDNIRNGSF